MEKALAIQKEVERILGGEVYLVGGSVRDLVMGNTPKDYDFTTPLLPEEVESKIKSAGRHAYTIGKAFGTIGFKVPAPVRVLNLNTNEVMQETRPFHKGFEYVEVTTYRSEVYTSKSRKPEVQFVPSLEEDLARRDFTMNAMVLKGDGKIFDPYGGRLDIHAKQIKTVGMPKDRIQEDPLRMLRAARFAARYDFTIDPNFIGKARQLADRIFDVSVERWVQELDKLLVSEHYYSGMQALESMGIWKRILPEQYDYPDGPAVDADLAWKSQLRNVNEDSKVAKYVAAGICHRLKFSRARCDIILT
jgi:poly(A) polymerase